MSAPTAGQVRDRHEALGGAYEALDRLCEESEPPTRIRGYVLTRWIPLTVGIVQYRVTVLGDQGDISEVAGDARDALDRVLDRINREDWR